MRKVLVNRFYDGAREDQADKDVLTTMSTISQGKQDVFKYSRKVIKLLQRMPNDLKRYDDIVTGYYLNGLTSQRLYDLAVSNFRKRNSCETPLQVVHNVVHLAIQLKLKGYRNQINKPSDDEDEDEDGEDDGDDNNDEDEDNATYAAGIYSGSEDEGNGYGRGRCRRKAGRMTSVRKVKGRKRAKSTERKNLKGSGKGREGGGEMSQLREIVRDLRQMQKAMSTQSTGVRAGRTEEDVIPLDTCAVGRNLKRRYEQYNASGPVIHQAEYLNRRGQVTQLVNYQQERRGEYSASHEDSRQEIGRMGPPTRSYFDGFTRQPTQGSRIPQGSNSPRAVGNTPEAQSIIGPDGAVYYRARSRRCYHCLEEGHIRPQCPLLRSSIRSITLGPEHPDTSPLPDGKSAIQSHGQPVNLIEIAPRSSALQGMKVREVTAAAVENPDDLKKFVRRIEKVDEGDHNESDGTDSEYERREDDDEEEEEEEAAPVMAGEKARRRSEEHTSELQSPC